VPEEAMLDVPSAAGGSSPCALGAGAGSGYCHACNGGSEATVALATDSGPPIVRNTAGNAAAAAAVIAASEIDDPSESEEEDAPAQPVSKRQLLIAQRALELNAARLATQRASSGTGGVQAQSVHSRAVFARLAAKLTMQPTGFAACRAPLLHAGAVFDSIEKFTQAVEQEQERSKSQVVLHKRSFN
jgi:hypothetical protein